MGLVPNLRYIKLKSCNELLVALFKSEEAPSGASISKDLIGRGRHGSVLSFLSQHKLERDLFDHILQYKDKVHNFSSETTSNIHL